MSPGESSLVPLLSTFLNTSFAGCCIPIPDRVVNSGKVSSAATASRRYVRTLAAALVLLCFVIVGRRGAAAFLDCGGTAIEAARPQALFAASFFGLSAGSPGAEKKSPGRPRRCFNCAQIASTLFNCRRFALAIKADEAIFLGDRVLTLCRGVFFAAPRRPGNMVRENRLLFNGYPVLPAHALLRVPNAKKTPRPDIGIQQPFNNPSACLFSYQPKPNVTQAIPSKRTPTNYLIPIEHLRDLLVNSPHGKTKIFRDWNS